MGEGHLATMFEDEHIKNNSGWQSGQGALGVVHNNQAAERAHQEDILKTLRSAQQEKFGCSRKRVPVDFAIRHLGAHLVAKSKALAEEIEQGRGFSLTKTYNKEEAVSGENWVQDRYTVQLAPGFYACRQNIRDTNSLVTKEECLRILAIHKDILNGDFKRELLWEEAKLLCSIIYTTLEGCFNCLDYMDHLGCGHVYGARHSEGLDSPMSDMLQAHRRDTIPDSKKTTRRSKKRKKVGFQAKQGTLLAT